MIGGIALTLLLLLLALLVSEWMRWVEDTLARLERELEKERARGMDGETLEDLWQGRD